MRSDRQFHAAITILHDCLQKYEQLEGRVMKMTMMMMIIMMMVMIIMMMMKRMMMMMMMIIVMMMMMMTIVFIQRFICYFAGPESLNVASMYNNISR